MREVNCFRSCARTIPLDAIWGANSRLKLSSPIASSLIWNTKTGALCKVFRSGELQIDVDYGHDLNCCSVVPSALIAEVVPTLMYDTAPVELLATPASSVLSLQQRTHTLSIGGDGTEPPLSVVTEKAIWIRVAGVSSLGCGQALCRCQEYSTYVAIRPTVRLGSHHRGVNSFQALPNHSSVPLGISP